MKTTKEEILKAALGEFSKNGYDGALLRDIASSVGVGKSALYKHYENKEALFVAMIDFVDEYYCAHFDRRIIEVPKTLDELKALSLRQISFTIHDEMIIKTRKLLSVGQYSNPRISSLATSHFITGVTDYYEKIFSGMMENGVIKKGDAKAFAYGYALPISSLIALSDRDGSKTEECLGMISRHIDAYLELIKE